LQGGTVDLNFSSMLIDLGKVPKDTERTEKIKIRNVGDVPVSIGLSAENLATNEITTSFKTDGLELELLEPNSSKIRVLKDASVGLKVKVEKTGPLELNFKVNILATVVVPPPHWQLTVIGIGDEVILSEKVQEALAAEVLASTLPTECSENAHLHRVLEDNDYVASVSIHHLMAMVEPACKHGSLQPILAMPPAFSQGVLQHFKKWYHTRAAVKMGGSAVKKWGQIENMLKPPVHQRDV
jgi:hypothetical protein